MSSEPAFAGGPPAEPDLREVRKVAVSSLLGTAMEWYDYFLYGIFAALVFNDLFFPQLAPTAGTIVALLSFAVGFLARPVGGLIFGHLGDRIGRKRTLIITIVMIGSATGLIGLLPTYDTIGVAAPILLVSLRVIQGLSLGGEWSGAILMAVEHAPQEKRAIYGAMPQLGSPVGTVMSSGIVALVTLLPEEDLLAWGWRLPFLLSFVMLGIALYLRLRVEESPIFRELAHAPDRERAAVPAFDVVRFAWPQVLLVFITCLFASGGFFLMTTYSVNFGTRVLGMAASLVLVATMFGALLEAVGVVLGGFLADLLGPWKVVAGGGAVAFVLTVPIVLLIGSGSPWLAVVGIAVGIGVLGLPYGPLGSLLSQLFDDRFRYSGVAISYNLAGLLGGFVPSIALAMSTRMGDSVWVIGILLGVIVALTAIGGYLSGVVVRRRQALEVGAAER